MKQHIPNVAAAKQAIVLHPASEAGLTESSELPEFFLSPPFPGPLVDLLADLFRCTLADGRREVDFLLSQPVADQPRSEGVTQKIKRDLRVVPPVVLALTIHNLCLAGMERQATRCESCLKDRFQCLSFPFTGTMAYDIVRIAFELDATPALLHPAIKDVVQEQVCQ